MESSVQSTHDGGDGRPSGSELTAGTSRKARQRSTCWSVIVRAQGSGDEARHALGELIRRYDGTVTAIVRGFGHPWNRPPEDLKQEFFTAMLARGDVLKLDPERGRFRNWLRVAVENFMRNEWQTWLAERRGNRETAPHTFQVQHGSTPELVCMRQFAEDTLLLAIARHREEATDKARFDRLLPFLPRAQLELPELAEVAAELGIPRNRLAVQIHLMREKHKRILREIVADTLDVDPGDPEGGAAVACEMGELYRFLREVPRTHVVLEDV